MRRFKFWAIGLISFFSIAAGTILHRALAVSLCAVLGFNSTVCYLGDGDRVNAAVPPGRSDVGAIIAQGTDIFRNDGGSSQQQQPDIFNNPNPQSTPQPGVDIFNNPNAPNRPIQQQPTVGSREAIWIYSAYAAPSLDYVIFSTPIKITNTGNDTIASVCENCQPSQLPPNFFESKTPLKKAIVADFKNLSSTNIETVESTDGEAIWGVIYEKNSTREVYFTLGKITTNNTKINKIPNSNISQIHDPILASNALVNLRKYLPLLIGSNTSAASKQGILVSSSCIPPNWSFIRQWISNAENAELLKTNLIVGEAKREQAVITYLVGQKVAENAYYLQELFNRWGGKGSQVLPNNYPISLKEDQLKMEHNNQLWATTSFSLQDSYLVAQCIPPQVLGTLAELAGIAALATLIAVSAIVAEWCINNPVGCKALARNPGATAGALINTPPQPQQTAQCGQQKVSGYQAGDTRVVKLNNNRGKINVSYEMGPVPDRLQVIYEGSVIIDTGFVSGVGNRSISFIGKSNEVTVVVTGNPSVSTTEWNYTLSCPQ